MKKLVLFFIIIFSLGSCSNKDLDREKAEKLITEFYEYPNVEFFNVSMVSIGSIPQYYSQLVHDGYFTFKNEQWRGIFFITNKAQPYLKEKFGETYTFVGNEVNIQEVTGIKLNDTKNQATVYYRTIRQNLTPIAKSYGRSESDTEEKEVHFELFDDGWRISHKKPQNIFKTADYTVLDKKYSEQLEKELPFVGLWKSVTKIGDCHDFIEIFHQGKDGISANAYPDPQCAEYEGFSVSNGKLENNLLTFEGDDYFAGLKLSLSNGFLIDNLSADKFKYNKIK